MSRFQIRVGEHVCTYSYGLWIDWSVTDSVFLRTTRERGKNTHLVFLLTRTIRPCRAMDNMHTVRTNRSGIVHGTVGTVCGQISNYNFKLTDSRARYANADCYDCRDGWSSVLSFLIFVFVRCPTVTRLSFTAAEDRSIFGTEGAEKK